MAARAITGGGSSNALAPTMSFIAPISRGFGCAANATVGNMSDVDEIWVYLDANIVRGLETTLDPRWAPPPDLRSRVTSDWRLGRTDVQFMAAGRFYWYCRKRPAQLPGLWPVVSSTVRQELARRPNGDYTLGVFFDMDESRDALRGR